jgi:cytochrome c5|tara:strand:+ start:38751 stop:39350 length:600 start_codon:yes stop_codon:yes gene_type:complete
MSKWRKTLLTGSTLALIVVIGLVSFADSMPILMDRFNENPSSKAEHKDNCMVCHVRADGSGPLTYFGERYDRVNLKFTPELMQEFPNLFKTNDVSSASETSARETVSAVVPGNESFDVKKYYRAECKKCHGKYGDGDPFQGVPAWATEKWLKEQASDPESLLNIILNGKDKMIGHAGKITEDDARELLDLVLKIAKKYS